eukprot:GILJ01001544.1.p1 GENE.GILJ01001544.1~~GILJ01001544.1.p1  ORF type:complete len:412 (+),score=59.00 GILJ01001544.1:95-1330(+)
MPRNLAACMSSDASSAATHTTPVREFIFDRLYHPQEGYFSAANTPVGVIPQPIDFQSLLGKHDYLKAIRAAYPQHSWLTPVEIFQPYYGKALADYIYRTASNKKDSLHIVEVGGGTGTCADSILDHIKRKDARVYSRMQYTIVEISRPLADMQFKRLNDKHPDLFSKSRSKPRGSIVNRSLLDFDSKIPGECFVIALEVLDNLPHDKVVKRASSQLNWDEVHVRWSETGETPPAEVCMPVQDNLIKDCLTLFEQRHHNAPEASSFFSRIDPRLWFGKEKETCVFLPTACLQFVRALHKNIPQHKLIFADFDELPTTGINGRNAPIVSRKGAKPEETFDYDTYLVPRGSADIFFPTDFELLKLMYQNVTGRPALVVKSKDFMQNFALVHRTSTMNGYNPLLEEFPNTSILIS